MKLFIRIALLIVLSTAGTISARAVTAGFTADVSTGCAPLVVRFTNTSAGATSYFWDFGTGTTSTLTDPSTSFTKPGTYTVKLVSSGGGSSSTTTIVITVYPNPTVSFTALDTSVCPGAPVSFTSTTIGGVPGPVTYTWSFGDGGISTLPAPSHVYVSPGYYNVTLTATNAMGCVSTLTMFKFVHILNPPVPKFSATTYFCKAPGTAVFSDLTTGTPGFTYAWTFGDGGSATGSSPSHTYAALGTYDVSLKVTDGNGCTDSVKKIAYIKLAGITAGFTFPASACEGATVVFPNTSSAHISSSWSYGDGGSGTSETGSYSYSAPGTYTVTLTVFDGFCYDSVKHTIVINPKPVAGFTQTPAAPCPPPTTMSFIGAVPSGSTATWSFGDGGTGSGSSVTHLYSRRGIYKVTMTTINATTGCSTDVVRNDTMYDMELIVADSPNTGCKPLVVYFKSGLVTHIPDTSKTYPYPYPPVSYTWDYGDGSSIYVGSSAPAHTYTAVGTFFPVLTVLTANGCVIRDTAKVTVGEPPLVTFSTSTPHVCYGKPIRYDITLLGGTKADFYFWQFGDFFRGGMGEYGDTGSYFIYKDKIPGVFTVTLTPTYHGCTGMPIVRSLYITVDSPRADYMADIQCKPARTVIFTDSSMGDDTRLWVFGDGATSTLKNPTHAYASPIVYNGFLATYNATSGCRDTIPIGFDFQRPTTSLLYKPVICTDTRETITAVPSGPGSVTYSWIECAGYMRTVSPVRYPVFCLLYGNPVSDSFIANGTYPILSIRQYSDGCKDTMPFTIQSVKPIVSFTATPATGCAPLPVSFLSTSTDEPGTTFTRYAWDFGDGSPGTTGSAPAHTFTAAGTYSTKLVVTDNIGCIDSVTTSAVTVWQPHAEFSSVKRVFCVGDSTQFVNTSTGGGTSLWSFGDGGTSTANSPWHTYTVAGSFNVKLTETDAHGCTQVVEYINYITAQQPAVGFYMDDSFTICPPLFTNFFNTTTGAVSYLWDLGDGSFSTATSPSNIYTTKGYYNVTLTATDAFGCKAIAYGHPNVYGSAGSFTYTPLKGCSPLLVHFKGLISDVPDVIWDFSDGSTAKTALTDTISHIYTLPGSYIPKLILSDNTGCQASTEGADTIKVDIVYPAYTSLPNPVCIGDTVYYKDSSSSYFSNITSYLWTFHDATTANTSATQFYYPVDGTFPLTLVVTDGWGCTGTINNNVEVHPLPIITACPDTIICVSDKATLTGYGGATYSWSPPATLSCTGCNPSLAKPSVVTTYTVVGTDKYGCKNIDTVLVGLRTKAESHATGDTEVCRNVAVQLRDSGGTSYLWIPGAGLSNATIAAPYAMPAATTRYTVVAYLGSCIPDTNTVWVTIHQLPTVNAGEDQRLLEGSTAQLEATGTLIEKYTWFKDPTLSCDSCPAPLATMSVTTTYGIQVSSDFGCKATDSVTIHIYCDKSQIFIPNTFTPNGDGQNDVFYPHGIGVSIINTFRIYNRWGELLFERSGIEINDASNAWDGSYHGSVPKPDVYVYVLEALCQTGEPLYIKGDVTVIR